MMMKKAQSQIITTVLIILLVLAAVVIVWQVINTTVREGAEQIETQSSCLGLNLQVIEANLTAFSWRRDPGAQDQTKIDLIYFVEGQNMGDLMIDVGELDSGVNVTTTGTVGQEVQLAGRLKDGTLCPLGPGRKIVDGAL